MAVAVVVLMLIGNASLADDRRAHVNYMLHCQGCHLPDARGLEGKVPPIKDFAGYFLHSQEGRAFLIRVPGVAHAALNNTEITEMMNWLLRSFSVEQLPDEFVPFTVAEVAQLRLDPETDPDGTRTVILANIATVLPSLAAELINEDQ